ncbi:hydrolase [Marinomonas agarivorans]|nr:hydrolase [Marinomonas agarivorans]
MSTTTQPLRFYATGILKNRHLQTLFAPLFRTAMPLSAEVETVELDDGDFVDCYWLNKPNDGEKKPIAVLFHGLEGSFKSPYIQGVMTTLSQQGYACVLMHFRGCSGRPNRLPRSYYAGETKDAKHWINQLANRYPAAPLFAAGYSLGGNMLLKLLAEYGDSGQPSPFRAAVAVSAPMVLDDSARTISKGVSRLYERNLLRSLKQKLLKKYQQHDMESLIGKTPNDIKKITSIRQFDDYYTATIHGFSDAQMLYEKNSAKPLLKKIHTNTLIVHALDDPFMTPDVLPEKCLISARIELDIHTKGGHVGFVMGSVFKPVYYLDHKVPEFFNRYLNIS